MYALLIKEKNHNTVQKKVVSIHASRKDAERALEQRREELGKDIWECEVRIIWTNQAVPPGEILEDDEPVAES